MVIKKIKLIFLLCLSVFCFVLCSFSSFSLKLVSADNVKVDKIDLITPVTFINNDSDQHFAVYFDQSVFSENLTSAETYSTISDYIYINGISVSDINETGKKKPDNKTIIKDCVKINIWGDGNTENEKFGFHFFIDDILYIDYKFKFDDNDTVTFKKGLSYDSFILNNDITARYYNTIEDWKTVDDLKDETINTIKNITAPIYSEEQDVYYYCVVFENIPTDKAIGYADYDNIISHIYYDNKTIKQLNNQYGENSAYIRFQGGVYSGQTFEGNQMYVTISGEIVRNEGLNDNTTITLKKGLVLPSLSYLDKDYTYYYVEKDNYWVCKKPTYEYTDLALSEISTAVYDNASGSYYIVLYFNKDVSFHYLPQVNAETDWLAQVYNEDNSICYYSFSFLQALIYDNIRESVKNYIYINGKSIAELCENETKVQKDQSISVNYCGTTFNSKAIQIGFNPKGCNAYNPNQENIIEIKSGFTSPLHGKTTKDYKFNMNTGLEVNEETQQEEPVNSQGCSSTVYSNKMFILIPSISVALYFYIKRRRRNESK